MRRSRMSGWRARWGRHGAIGVRVAVAFVLLATIVGDVPAVRGRGEPAVACVGARPDQEAAATVARACGHEVEVLDQRSETARVFAAPDGTARAEIHAAPVRFARDGRWQPIDLTLRESGDAVAPAGHPNDLRLSGARPKGTHELAAVGLGAARVAMSWTGALPRPVLNGTRATYVDALPGVDLVVEATRTGFAQSLVVKERAAAGRVAAVPLLLSGPGAAKHRRDKAGDITLLDAAGRTTATVPAPAMWDAKTLPDGSPARTQPISTSTSDAKRGGVRLTLRPDQKWLRAPGTRYPVTLDPTVNPLSTTFDTYVREGLTTNQSGAVDLQIGLLATAPPTINRSFLTWNTAVLAGKHIQAATVNFWNFWSHTCTAQSWEIWTTGAASTSTRFTNQPAWLNREATSTATHGSTDCADAWAPVNGVNFFQRAASANATTAHMGLRATDETAVTTFKQFRSREATDTSQVPYASVTYQSYPVLGTRATVPATACVASADRPFIGSLTPQLQAVVSDPDGGSPSAEFEWWHSGGVRINGATVSVASGANATTTVPAGQFVEGGTYSWRVRARDAAGGVTAWSAWCEFTVDTGPPTAPVVSSVDYPADGQEHGAAGQPGYFLARPAGWPAGQAAQWSLTDGANFDRTGNGHDLSARGGLSFSADASPAVRFDGVDDSAVTEGPVLNTSGSFTVSAWVRLEQTDRSVTALSQDGTRVSGFTLGYSGDSRKWTFARPNSDTDSPTLTYVASRAAADFGGDGTARPLTHLTGVYDAPAQTLTLYVNGRSQGSVAYTGTANAAGRTAVGRAQWNGSDAAFYPGRIGTVQVWNRALTAAEALAIGDITTVRYRWDTDQSTSSGGLTAMDLRSVFAAPPIDGQRTLTFWNEDRAGRQSATAAYTFRVAPAGPHHLYYDAAGQLVAMRQESNGGTAIYDYDANGNLRGVERRDYGFSVLSVVPARAAVGSRVEIGVSHLTITDPTVTFTGTSTPAEIVSSANGRLVVLVPPGATTGPIKVTLNGGQGPEGASPSPFTVIPGSPAPDITGISTTGADPGSTVTINGSGFDPNRARDTVVFGRTTARVTAATTTQLTVVVPDAATSGRVQVRTPGGVATSDTDFVVPPRPYTTANVVDGGRLAVDGPQTTVTVPAGKTGLFRFEGNPGDKLSLGLTGAAVTGTSKVRLYTPYGGSFARDQFDTAREVPGITGGIGLPALTTAGVYQIAIEPPAGAGALTLTLSRQAQGTLDAAGQGSTFTVDRAGRYTEFTFTGGENAAMNLGFGDWSLPSNAQLDIAVYAPPGDTVGLWRDEFAAVRDSSLGFKTQMPGTYRVVVGVRNAGLGSARMWLSPEINGGTLAVGGAGNPITFSRPGQWARLAFDGTAGQRLGLGFSDLTLSAGGVSYRPAVALVNPDGTRRNLSGGEEFDIQLTAAGRHELIVVAGPATGGARAWLSGEADGGTITAGTDKTVTVARSGQNQRLRFTGTAGQRLSLGVVSSALPDDVWFQVYGPGGNQIVTWAGDVDLPQLSVTGTYEILLDPDSGGTGAITLALSPELDGGTVAVDGAGTPVSIGKAGQNARIRFTGAAGQRLNLGFSAASVQFVNLTAYRPDGSQLVTRFTPTSEGLDLPALPVAGTYEVVIDPDGGATANLTVIASTEADGGVATVNGPGLPVTVTRPGQTARIAFDGTAGDARRVTMAGASFSKTFYDLRVLAPNGAVVVDESLLSIQSTVDIPALPATGRYLVVVKPALGGTGSITLGVATRTAAFAAASAAKPAEPVERCPAMAESRPAAATGFAVTAPPRPAKRTTAGEPDAGAPTAGWRACGFPKAAQPAPKAERAWKPDAKNLAGRDWITRFGAPPAPAGLGSAPKDTTAVAGQVRTVAGTPLRDVTLTAGQVRVKTDAEGRFLLSGVESGRRVLRVDARGVGGTSYGVFDIGVDLQAGITTHLPYTIFLPEIDKAATVKVDSPTRAPVVLRTPAIPGLEVRVPAGTVVRDGDGKVAKELSITAIPIDRPPFPLPPTRVPIYFTVQPGGGYLFPAGAQVVYPNYTGESPGTRMDFWSYDPEGQGWHIYGRGTVSPDGKRVVPDRDVKIYRFTGAMTAVPGHEPPPVAPKSPARVADPVDPSTGLLVDQVTDLAIDDVMPIALRRTYQQGDPYLRAFGVGTSFDYGAFPWSTGNIGNFTYLEADLVLGDGSRIHFRRIVPGEKTFLDAVFAADPSPRAEFRGALMYWNGNGWDIKLRDGTTLVLGDEAPLQAIRDRYGNTTTITRAPAPADPDGNVRARGPVTQITSPSGKWIKLTYNTANPPQVTRAEDSLGRSVSYTYVNGYLDTVTDANNGVTKYTWENGRLKTIRDARNLVYLTNEYDAEGRVLKQTAPDGGFWSFAYTKDSAGRITETRVTDPRNTVRRFTFNAQGQVLTDTRGLGTAAEQVTTIQRDAAGMLPTATVDALNRRTEFEYNAAGDVIRITRLAGTPEAHTERFTRDGPFGEVSKYTGAYGAETLLTYEPNGALQTVTDPVGHTTTYATDGAGRVTSVTDNDAKTTTIGYALGDPVSFTDPLGRTTRLTYDSAGRVVASTDPTGSTTETTYDGMDQVRAVMDPLGRTTAFEYDANGNLTKVTDPRLATTVLAYNNMDLLESVTDPLTRVESYVYDKNGNLTRHTSRRGKVTEFVPDVLDRVQTARYGVTSATAQESTVTYTLDKGDRVTRIVDSAGGTANYKYDGLDRVTEDAGPQGTVTYLRAPPSQADEPGVVVAVGGQTLYSDTYVEATGQRTVRDPAGNGVRQNQDGVGRLLSTYAYNPADPLGQGYSYDAAGQLKEIDYVRAASGTGEVVGKITYEYDAAGRPTRIGGDFARASVPAAFGPATYNAANQLTNLAGTAVTYDLDGNLTSDGRATYTWNARGQLTATTAGGPTTSYTYDPLGRRASQIEATGSTTSYVYDGLNPVQEKVGATVTAQTISGRVDEVFYRTSGGTIRRLLTDGLGNTVAVANGTGDIQARYAYDPFGRTTVAGNDGGNPYRYTGREQDGPDSLYHYRARYYSPTLQRFISEDPVGFAGGDANLHRYVGNAPTYLTDPLGLKPAVRGCTSISFGCGKATTAANWVDEGGFQNSTPPAPSTQGAWFRYQSGAVGTRSNLATGRSQVPQYTAPDGNGGVVTAKFDSAFGDEAIDRKLGLTRFGRDEAERQAAVARHHGFQAVYELPSQTKVDQANALLAEWGVTGIRTRVGSW
ncbi:RHS repeat-associated core domain-containing protein [Phytohabitans sp. LJ34]|uniref:RHS repeat-associated core domain-containing protein n=1 Tax=Phytohabitans sp. LJ34 TaxID=3452217 RepID=UPI003F8BB42E